MKNWRTWVAFLPLAALVLMAASGTVRWSQLLTADRHGSGSKGQSFSGSSVSGNGAKFDSSGALVDGGGKYLATLVCEVAVGDPGAASTALADDNDTPGVCANKTGSPLTVTAVECRANAAGASVLPIITGGASNSILTGALTCGNGSFAAGTLNGTPTQANGGTIDANIATAGGSAKYLVIRITRGL